MNSRTSKSSRPMTPRAVVQATLVVLAATTIILACSGSALRPSSVDPTGACGELASRCHPYDKLSALGHECHELGHAGDDQACGPRKAECLAACPPTEAGVSTVPEPVTDAAIDRGADAAHVDSGDDALCVAYCDCLMATCASQAGYPFTSIQQCHGQCATLTPDQRGCWPKWCERAKNLANKTHTCEHAWGKYDLDECETL